MRKLYLHIGVHRTATSSIQRFLQINSAELAKRGFLHPFGVARHNELINQLFDGRLDIETLIENLKQSADDSQSEIRALVLSDEDISIREDLSILTPLKAHFDVRVVGFLRRQDLWLESWYMQNVKWQWNPELCHLTFAEFLEKESSFHWIAYDKFLSRFEALFGEDSVKVQVFEPRHMPSGPYAAFCELIGLDDLDGLDIPKDLNHSLSPMITEFMRNLPLNEFGEQVRGRMEAACIALDADLRLAAPEIYDAKINLLSHAQRTEILTRYAKGNSAVAQRYFNRDELFEDRLPDPNVATSEMNLPPDSYEYTRLIVAPYFRHLATIIRDIQAGR